MESIKNQRFFNNINIINKQYYEGIKNLINYLM